MLAFLCLFLIFHAQYGEGEPKEETGGTSKRIFKEWRTYREILNDPRMQGKHPLWWSSIPIENNIEILDETQWKLRFKSEFYLKKPVSLCFHCAL
jgi:hypothetical protein